MSLPMPRTGSAAGFPANLSPAEQDALDAPLIALASKSGGDLRKLLYMFFSFLHRRTDFYCVPNELDVEEGVPLRMGFREGDAERLLLAAFRQFPLRRMPRQAGGGGPRRGPARADAKKGGDPAKAAPAPTGAKADESGGAAPVSAAAADTTTSVPVGDTKDRSEAEEAGPSKKAEPADPMRGVRRTEEGKQIPVGNGGTTERYQWTQTIDEATVIVGVPEGTRGKDLTVLLKPSSISVRMKKPLSSDGGGDKPPMILEGKLTEKIRADESTWSLEGGALLLTLDKAKKTWWETVLEGDDKIDSTLVDSTRKIGEYDEATQGAIRKIMFDQRQERLGLPTSDEILGKTPQIPPLPAGVEYIDKSTFEPEDGTDADKKQ